MFRFCSGMRSVTSKNVSSLMLVTSSSNCPQSGELPHQHTNVLSDAVWHGFLEVLMQFQKVTTSVLMKQADLCICLCLRKPPIVFTRAQAPYSKCTSNRTPHTAPSFKSTLQCKKYSEGTTALPPFCDETALVAR